jgi:hypothetical protein
MTTGETKEPTLTEIMGEIKKSKDEVIKQAEKSRISMWLTVAAFGASVVLFGGSVLARLTTSPSGIYSSGILISAIGLAFMIWARSMATKRQQEFKTKWNEPPRF